MLSSGPVCPSKSEGAPAATATIRLIVHDRPPGPRRSTRGLTLTTFRELGVFAETVASCDASGELLVAEDVRRFQNQHAALSMRPIVLGHAGLSCRKDATDQLSRSGQK